MKWKNINETERDEIFILRDKGYSMRSIAKSLNRSPNTISYELKHNKTTGTYDSHKAHAKSRLRKRMRKLQWKKIDQNRGLRQYVIDGLKNGWNPDEIAGRMEREKKPYYASKNSIYRWLRSSRGERYCKFLYSKRRYVKKRKEKTKRILIPNRISIHKRFKGAMNRTRYGHWEADTVVGKKNTPGGVKTAIERKTRVFQARIVKSMKPREHARALKEILSSFKVMSITFDNGIENRDHGSSEVPTFFCDPYSSWQKGSDENANKIFRRYFPKGTDFSKVSQEEVDRVIDLINEKPRKILDYRSAREAAEEAGIIRVLK
jgi:transposase, IS30 family